MCTPYSSPAAPAPSDGCLSSHCFHLLQLSVKNCFIRGSVVRYVQLPADEVDTQLLQDAARKEAMQQKQ